MKKGECAWEKEHEKVERIREWDTWGEGVGGRKGRRGKEMSVE